MKNTDIKIGMVAGLVIGGTVTGLTVGGIAPIILFGSGLFISVSEINNTLSILNNKNK